MYDPHFIEDCETYNLGKDLMLQGFSRAGDRTGFIIKSRTKQLGYFLDCGVNTYKKPKNIFITHSHLDHSQITPFVLSRDDKVNIYCLDILKPLIDNYVISSQTLNDCDPDITHLRKPQIEWILINADDNINNTNNTNNTHYKIIQSNIIMKPVKCYHSVPSIGYRFYETKQKLKKEYIGLKGNQIKQLRLDGISIVEDINVPLFTFLGDTHKDFEKTFDDIEQMPVIIIECTSFDDDMRSEKDMYERGHMHWFNILDLAKKYPKTLFAIIHFSRKYSTEFLENINKSNKLDNIMLII